MRVLTTLLLLTASTVPAQQARCIPAGVKLTYPPLARAARIAGAVVSKLRVGDDGHATILRIDGSQYLVAASRASIEALHYPTFCASNEYTLTFHYILSGNLDDPEETKQLGPADFLIAAKTLPVNN